MFMDDTTLSKVLDISNHLTGTWRLIGNTQRNVDSVIQFAIDERMELNGNKCKEMLIDFRKKRTEIPLIKIGAHSVSTVKSYKLLGLWLDNNLKWNTNTEYITKKAWLNVFTYWKFSRNTVWCSSARFIDFLFYRYKIDTRIRSPSLAWELNTRTK